MDQQTSANEIRSQAIYMFISALLFGYFGFFNNWSHQMTTASATPPNTLIPMVVLLKWTLRVGACCFALSGVLAMIGSMLGPLINCLAGLVTAGVFVIVAIWEWTNPQGYFSGVPPILLVVFALWNGHGSWMGLKELRARQAHSNGRTNAPDAPDSPFGQLSR